MEAICRKRPPTVLELGTRAPYFRLPDFAEMIHSIDEYPQALAGGVHLQPLSLRRQLINKLAKVASGYKKKDVGVAAGFPVSEKEFKLAGGRTQNFPRSFSSWRRSFLVGRPFPLRSLRCCRSSFCSTSRKAADSGESFGRCSM